MSYIRGREGLLHTDLSRLDWSPFVSLHVEGNGRQCGEENNGHEPSLLALVMLRFCSPV